MHKFRLMRTLQKFTSTQAKTATFPWREFAGFYFSCMRNTICAHA
jgi:hypothetical protein